MSAVQITNAAWSDSTGGRFGPFQDGSGNLWVVGSKITTGPVYAMAVFKSTDGGATWPTSYAVTTPSSLTGRPTPDAMDAVFDATNGVIYVLDVTVGPVIMSFTIGTTTWAQVSSNTGPPTTSTDANGKLVGYLTLRSTGEFVVFYQGPTHSSMGSSYRSVYYARCSSSGTWSAGVEVDAGGTSNYDCKSAVLGANDRVHMYYLNDPIPLNDDHRSLSNTNVLDTVSVIATGSVATRYYSMYYDATLGSVVVCHHTTIYRASSQANPTWTADSNTIESGTDFGSNSNRPFVYDPTGANLYIFFRDSTSSDVYRNSAASTTWGTAAQQDAATAVTAISVGLITNAIGVIFNDSNVYFDTYALAGGPKIKSGTGISERVGKGTSAFTKNETGKFISERVGSGPSAWTKGKTGRAVIDNLIGSGASQKVTGGTTYTKTGLAKFDNTVGSGPSAWTKNESGLGKSDNFMGFGPSVWTKNKSGVGITPFSGGGADAFTDVDTGVGVSVFAGGGPDVIIGVTYVKTGEGIIGP